MTSLHLTDSIFVQISSKTIHFPPCPHLIFPVALQLFIIWLSNCIVYSSHTNSIVRGKKCLFAQLDSLVRGIKDAGLLELLIYSSLCSIFLKMKIAKKQSVQEMYGWMLLQLHVPADGWCPPNIWEHALAHCHSSCFQRSWQNPTL